MIPWEMVTTITRNDVMKMIVYFDFSERPMARTTSGISAIGGIDLKNWIHGSRAFLSFGYQPIRNAIGTAHRNARPNPTRTL